MSRRYYAIAAVGIVSLICFWILWGIFSVQIAHKALGTIFVPTQAGAWGDSFGPFSAVFSALGFGAVIITLAIQQNQIKDAQREQHRQQFENTFFQLVTMIRENRDHVRFRYSADYARANGITRTTLNGHAAFRAAFNELKFWVEEEQRSRSLSKSDLARIYARKIHVRYESTLGAYHRIIYSTLDRVRSDPHLSETEKNNFANIIRGQFTSYEAVIAGYNGLNEFAKDLDKIIVRFRLLKYARKGIVCDELRKHYPPETFAGRDGHEEPASVIDDADDDD